MSRQKPVSLHKRLRAQQKRFTKESPEAFGLHLLRLYKQAYNQGYADGYHDGKIVAVMQEMSKARRMAEPFGVSRR